jgi:hypothetical protein
MNNGPRINQYILRSVVCTPEKIALEETLLLHVLMMCCGKLARGDVRWSCSRSFSGLPDPVLTTAIAN